MTKAIDYIKEFYVTESELTQLLGVDAKRVRDLRSNHVTGKKRFIDHIKPTSKSVLYRIADVMQYLENQKTISFGKEKVG